MLCANFTVCRFNLFFFISGSYKPFIYWSQFSFRQFCFCFASALQHAEEVQRKGASFARDAMIEENWSKYLRFFVTMPLDRALPLRTAIQMCPVQVRYLVCFINNFYSALSKLRPWLSGGVSTNHWLVKHRMGPYFNMAEMLYAC